MELLPFFMLFETLVLLWLYYLSVNIIFQTNLPVFKVKESSVRRRYSDFEWLRSELERDSKVRQISTTFLSIGGRMVLPHTSKYCAWGGGSRWKMVEFYFLNQVFIILCYCNYQLAVKVYSWSTSLYQRNLVLEGAHITILQWHVRLELLWSNFDVA